MEIAQSTSTTSATSTATTQTTSSSAISSDFETFLRMLTVQMENQDPLNPVDSSDYAVQLATFSNVEQQVQTNDLLRELKGQLGLSGIAQMADWVGKEALAVAPAQLDGTPITVFPTTAEAATEADVVVRDETGLEVARFSIPPSNEPVEWAGVTTDGYPFPDGLYTFDIESFNDDVLLETSQAAIYATVTEVRKNDVGDTSVVLSGGVSVSTDAVTAIRDQAA